MQNSVKLVFVFLRRVRRKIRIVLSNYDYLVYLINFCNQIGLEHKTWKNRKNKSYSCNKKNHRHKIIVKWGKYEALFTLRNAMQTTPMRSREKEDFSFTFRVYLYFNDWYAWPPSTKFLDWDFYFVFSFDLFLFFFFF